MQRDKLTGNTKSAKKKLKYSQQVFLEHRIIQLKSLLTDRLKSEKDNHSDSNEEMENNTIMYNI